MDLSDYEKYKGQAASHAQCAHAGRDGACTVQLLLRH